MRSRLSIVRHISFFGTIRVLMAFVRWEKRIFQNFERFSEGPPHAQAPVAGDEAELDVDIPG